MDSDEFRSWYETVAPDLYRYTTRICNSVEESEDVFQGAFTRLLGSSRAFDDPVDRRRFLFRIATNLARDRRRWTRRWGLTSLPKSGEGSLPLDSCERIDVQRAFSRLPTKSRALLWLAYVLGLSHEEIAETVGVATTSVKVLLSRARKKFLEHVQRTEL